MFENPVFRRAFASSDNTYEVTNATYKGVTIKTLILLGIAALVGIATGVGLYVMDNISIILILFMLSGIIELFCVIIGRGSLKYAKPCGIIYAMCEGIFLGTITALFNIIYPGIALMAVSATAIVFVVCLSMFAGGLMRDTGMLSRMLVVIFISTILSSLLILLLRAFNVGGIATLLIDSPSMAIGITLAFLLYGAIMLFLNFNEAYSYVSNGAPKGYEWSAAFGLMVSILYIYLEMLRIIAMFRDRK